MIIASDYYGWDPSPDFNAVPLEEGNDTNRLFTKLEHVFKPTAKKKIVESTWRFKDIFKNVIFPNVQAALEAVEGSEEVSSEEVDGEMEAEVTTLLSTVVEALANATTAE